MQMRSFMVLTAYGLPHEAYGGLTIITLQVERNQSTYFVFIFFIFKAKCDL